MSGIHPFSLVRYSTMSCALHFTAALSISGVTSTLSSNFRRFPLPLGDGTILSTSILTKARSLRRMATITGKLPFQHGVAPWSNKNRTSGMNPTCTALVNAYPSCESAFGGRRHGHAYRYLRKGSGGSRSDQSESESVALCAASARNRRLGRSGAGRGSPGSVLRK